MLYVNIYVHNYQTQLVTSNNILLKIQSKYCEELLQRMAVMYNYKSSQTVNKHLTVVNENINKYMATK